MNKCGLILTIIADITSNYGESLGNISTIQKVYRNGRAYASRSRESIKYAIMDQAGMYDDLVVSLDKAAQKWVDETECNISNCRALEGGYMNTGGKTTYTRNSTIKVSDAVSCVEWGQEIRFHNDLNVARKYSDRNNTELKDSGLMPYNYEYDQGLKVYNVVIELDRIGIDKNFDVEATPEEKANRVINILRAIQELRLEVKQESDNAEPLFIVGGIGSRKTHYFKNLVNVDENNNLEINNTLKDRIKNDYRVGVLDYCKAINNTQQIKEELNSLSVDCFFDKLIDEVKEYYNVEV